MKYIKIIFLLGLITTMSYTSFAQQKTFDIVTYTPPNDWIEKQAEGNISYSIINGSSWAQIAIYQHRTSNGDINTDFDKDWSELVAANKTISSPEKNTPQTAEGWTIMSGSGVWKYNGTNVASMLTVYSNQKICIAILCNTTAKPYLKDYQSLVSSLNLDANSVSETSGTANNVPSTDNNTSANKNSVVGLWCDNHLEISGYFNGFPQYTAGYFRREYLFKADGTYVFRLKNWSTLMKEILFNYESGTYTIQGNQLTIIPNQGRGEWWSKKDNNASLWGNRLKASDYKLEKMNYVFEIKYYSGTDSYSIILYGKKDTDRDGTYNQNGFSYARNRTGQSIIDNPPGFKTGFENK
jgi:hypothetical protein